MGMELPLEEPQKHVVNMLVNGTYQPISIYDDNTGLVFTFEPVPRHQRRLALGTLPEGSALIVAEKTLIKRLKNAGGPLDDMAYVKATSPGRFDSENPHVVWDGSSFYCELRPAKEPPVIAEIVEADNRNVRVRFAGDCQTQSCTACCPNDYVG